MSTNQTSRKPPDTDAQMELRDSIMMDLHSTSGLNFAELSRLTVRDVDTNSNSLQVYHANSMLTAPVKPATMKDLRQYIKDFRQDTGTADAALFVSVYTGEPMTRTHVQKSMLHHVKQLRQIGELPATSVSQLVTAESIRRNAKPE